jgi:hypothetical protein
MACYSIYGQYASGADIIKQMHRRYENKWYERFTFKQRAVFYNQNKPVKTQIWYEAAHMPGRLIIKYDSLSSANGLLFNRDSVFIFKDSLSMTAKPYIHEVLLVGFDVYFLSPEETIERLQKSGFDLRKIHSRIWKGRPTWIIGALSGDSVSNQFWVDAGELYLVKLVKQKQIEGKNGIELIELEKYKKINGHKVATQLSFYRNNQLYLKEEYFDIQFPKQFTEGLFEPQYFDKAKW